MFSTTPGRPEARPLTDPGTTLASVSATGDLLLRVRREGKVAVARAPLAGGVPRLLVDDAGAADLSPDGTELAVVRERDGLSRLEYPVGRTLVTTRDLIATLRISPRGDRVAFVRYARVAGYTVGTARFETGTVEVVERGGERRTLGAPWSHVATSLAWAPGGDEVWVAGRRDAFLKIHASPSMGASGRCWSSRRGSFSTTSPRTAACSSRLATSASGSRRSCPGTTARPTSPGSISLR